MNLSHLTRLLCIGVILIGESAAAAPAPKANRQKILGVWEVTKSDDGTPAGTTIEFTKDGKMTVKAKVGDETLTLEGIYKLERDKVTLTYREPGGQEMTDTATITKLTDKELILKDDKGKIDEFKRKK
jgi:uncharacterized protein (TIGR03066 family)